MAPSYLLFPGVPGGPELLVVLLLMVALFGLPVLVVLLGWRTLRRDGDRVSELERRVIELERELRGEGGSDDNRAGDGVRDRASDASADTSGDGAVDDGDAAGAVDDGAVDDGDAAGVVDDAEEGDETEMNP